MCDSKNGFGKAKKRIYLNLTNRCNVKCDFCCMFSEPNKNTFLSFDKYKEIIDNSECFFELQLEGGEPFLHEDFYLFVEYARFTGRCTKITISTNGILLSKHLQRLTNFCDFSKIPIVIKRSINYYLYNLDNWIFKKCRDLYLATEFIPNFKIEFNVRLRKEDNWIVEKLKEFKIYEQSRVYELQNYGRMGNDLYSKPFIVRNIDEFFLYASDGKCFNDDMVKRSEYEKTLK
jgi:MoaA/NifB/PqqE/SkfB family radical SAM enzyme